MLKSPKHAASLRGAASALGGLLLAFPMAADAGSLDSAHVTKIVNDVRIYKPDTAARRARPGDLVAGRTSLQTGRRSRSELRFQDQTLTRLGANSIFSFEQGTRDLQLDQGTLLLQVPKNLGGARLNTPTVTASVTGTTIMVEYFADQWAKMIVLEGSLEVWPLKDKRNRVRIKAGEMTVFRPDQKVVPKPVKVDLKRLMQTSGLIDPETFGPLPKEALDKIAKVIKKQEELKKDDEENPALAVAEDPAGDRGALPDRGDFTPDGPPVIINLPRRH